MGWLQKQINWLQKHDYKSKIINIKQYIIKNQIDYYKKTHRRNIRIGVKQ